MRLYLIDSFKSILFFDLLIFCYMFYKKMSYFPTRSLNELSNFNINVNFLLIVNHFLNDFFKIVL